MTQKELLYIEDTLGHLQTFQDLCMNAKTSLQDQKLKTFVNKQLTKSKNQFSEIYKFLGGE